MERRLTMLQLLNNKLTESYTGQEGIMRYEALNILTKRYYAEVQLYYDNLTKPRKITLNNFLSNFDTLNAKQFANYPNNLIRNIRFISDGLSMNHDIDIEDFVDDYVVLYEIQHYNKVAMAANDGLKRYLRARCCAKFSGACGWLFGLLSILLFILYVVFASSQTGSDYTTAFVFLILTLSSIVVTALGFLFAGFYENSVITVRVANNQKYSNSYYVLRDTILQLVVERTVAKAYLQALLISHLLDDMPSDICNEIIHYTMGDVRCARELFLTAEQQAVLVNYSKQQLQLVDNCTDSATGTHKIGIAYR